jgi:MOSC domain-containing protein
VRAGTGSRRQTVGTVTELWRYPVKSMLGERCEGLDLDGRGVVGDRLYAVADGDGKFGSGKNTRRFRRIDGLFGLRARYDGSVPVVTFPRGHQVRGDDPRIDEELRSALRRPDVALAREAGVSHLDQGPLHLVTDASLAWLAGAVTDADVDSRRLRPNLVVETGRPAGFAEDGWVGRRASIGQSVVVEFTERTERCVMVNNAQDELTRSSQVLRAISYANDLLLGVYATIISTGMVHVGDEIALLADE